MRTLPPPNTYQQLLLSAFALVDEPDLIAIFRAARTHPERNLCIVLVNRELDKGISLMDAFDAPSPLHALFTRHRPELRVFVPRRNVITVHFGTFDPPCAMVSMQAVLSDQGTVIDLLCKGTHVPRTEPRILKGPRDWDLFGRS
jgi:hypothetical protein